MFYDFSEREIHIKSEKEAVINFLKKQGLNYESDIEYTMVIKKGNQIVATGSLNRNVLKCIAVDEEFRNMGLTNKVVSHLINKAYQLNETNLFVYTKPSNEMKFAQLGFYKIVEIEDKVLLMENNRNGLDIFLKKLSSSRMEGNRIAGIVVNCNPFTNGHKYLIEKAASECDWLHVFVVWEGKSIFPPEARFKLVKEGTKHINNVTVHQGINYIISSATFPSYFLKQDQDVVEVHAKLDLTIFGSKIAPTLGINLRYVGEEPYCPVTSKYNKIMKKILPSFGIKVIEVPRKDSSGEIISATKVRCLIQDDDYETAKKFIPESTYQYLFTQEGKQICENIKKFAKR